MKTTKKTKPNLFKGFPKALKDPKNYEKTEKRLQAIIQTSHKHKNMLDYSRCSKCQTKLMEKKKLMKELGFKSFAQYLEWKRIMGMMLEVKKIQNENKTNKVQAKK